MTITKDDLKLDYNLMGFIPEEDRSDFEELLSMNKNGLKYIPKDKQDLSLINKFFPNKDYSIQFLNSELISENDILDKLKNSPHIFLYLNNNLQKEHKVIIEGLRNDGELLRKFPKTQQTKEMVHVAFNNNSYSIIYANAKFLTQEMAYKFIEDNPGSYYSCIHSNLIPSHFIDDSFITKAIHCDGSNIRYIDNPTLEQYLLALEGKNKECYDCIDIVENPDYETTLKNIKMKIKIRDIVLKS